MRCTNVTALFLVLTIYTVAANVVPKHRSEIMQFPKTVENNLGSQCQFDGLQGVCTEMGNCAKYVRQGPKADNDPCLNLRHTVVICCSNPPAAPKRTRAETSSEESSTDTIGNE